MIFFRYPIFPHLPIIPSPPATLSSKGTLNADPTHILNSRSDPGNTVTSILIKTSLLSVLDPGKGHPYTIDPFVDSLILFTVFKGYPQIIAKSSRFPKVILKLLEIVSNTKWLLSCLHKSEKLESVLK